MSNWQGVKFSCAAIAQMVRMMLDLYAGADVSA
jgi:hypothetical protein